MTTNARSEPRLGRGLAALLASADSEREASVTKVAIEALVPNPQNPRQNFDEIELEELAASIRRRGVLQPILVRARNGFTDSYEIIAGERRWRAAQRAELHEIPILVVSADDREALEIAIVENVQRSDLNPLEEAAGYASLMSVHGYSHDDIGRIVGRSRSHVANMLRLTGLSTHVQTLLSGGKLSAGHARALLALPDADRVADKIVSDGLSVRDVERLAGSRKRSKKVPVERGPRSDSALELQGRLSLTLGTAVRILRRSGEAGEIQIAFTTLEQLDNLCRLLLSEMSR